MSKYGNPGLKKLIDGKKILSSIHLTISFFHSITIFGNLLFFKKKKVIDEKLFFHRQFCCLFSCWPITIYGNFLGKLLAGENHIKGPFVLETCCYDSFFLSQRSRCNNTSFQLHITDVTGNKKRSHMPIHWSIFARTYPCYIL